ncbi:HAD-like domain-containing protein [Dactylonectria macrodidyma]|uniref:HAD-like domain-containing protein n=1 Tax=Dactylonectria macrodidyma TaxID=307937 RepID=A0A9P9EAW8_9HYPO|nr:HAD-like domain-containing protein [Dactylonectria macrodidyma]
MDSHETHGLRLEEFAFDGFLIDLDGTLIDSTEAVVRHWADVGKLIGVNPQVILESSHGRRSLDVLNIVASEFATWEFVRKIEGAIPLNHGHLATEIPGAVDFMTALIAISAPSALVTSSTLPLVIGWQKTLNLPLPEPEFLVTAESVPIGKPDPACYALGREKLGLTDETLDLLVVEDSPAGIEAGKAANCKVVGLLTSHTYEQIVAAKPNWIVQDLKSLKVLQSTGGKVSIEMTSLSIAPSGPKSRN